MSLLLALTGGSANYTLTAQGGAYALTGAAATLTKTGGATNFSLTAQGGSYSLTGASATVKVGKVISASGGSYSVAGQQATVKLGKRITALGGAYSLTGASATLTKASGQVEAYSGGYDLPTGRRKSKKEVYAERVKLGIIKEDIEQKALEVVAKAEKKTYTFEPSNRVDPQELTRQLMAELRLKVPSPDYSRAIEIAIRAAEQDEEDSLILLLA